jgi:hypothetical protein
MTVKKKPSPKGRQSSSETKRVFGKTQRSTEHGINRRFYKGMGFLTFRSRSFLSQRKSLTRNIIGLRLFQTPVILPGEMKGIVLLFLPVLYRYVSMSLC